MAASGSKMALPTAAAWSAMAGLSVATGTTWSV